MTTLLTIFITRWLLPTLYMFQSPKEARRNIITPTTMAVTLCATAFAFGVAMTRPQQPSYYMGMILWWAAVPLCLLFWGTARFVSRVPLRRGKILFLIALAIPTIYLWCCDLFALKRGTWHINEATSFNIFPIPQLPIEEMVFFFLTNLLLVIASFTFDRCIALARLQIGLASSTSSSSLTPPYSPSYLPLNPTTIKALWRTFIVSDPSVTTFPENSTQQTYVSDLQTSLRILSRASRSFSLASLLFSWDLRSDLSMLYAFCRAADDFVDEAEVAVGNQKETKQGRLKLLDDLVDAMYDYKSQLEGDQSARYKIRHVLWLYTQGQSASRLTPLQTKDKVLPPALEELRASASAVVSVRHLVPRSLWLELLRGYKRDLQLDTDGYEARFQTMDDLIEYAQCVAGCVGEMCVRVVLGRCGYGLADVADYEVDRRIPIKWDQEHSEWVVLDVDAQTKGSKDDDDEPIRALLYNARRMGVALQLVNIARDVVDDSLKLKRCYLPEDLLDPAESTTPLLRSLFAGTLRTQTETPSLSSHSPESLRPHILSLLDLASEMYHASQPSLCYFSTISKPVESGLRVACEVYFAIAHCIRMQTPDEIRRGVRARLSRKSRVWRAFKAVYGF